MFTFGPFMSNLIVIVIAPSYSVTHCRATLTLQQSVNVKWMDYKNI